MTNNDLQNTTHLTGFELRYPFRVSISSDLNVKAISFPHS